MEKDAKEISLTISVAFSNEIESFINFRPKFEIFNKELFLSP